MAATLDGRTGSSGPIDGPVALEACRIRRPPELGTAVEVVRAGAAPRRFPTRVSDTLGICLKWGPAHEVDVDGHRLRFPADAVSVRPPGSVWACQSEGGFLSVDVDAEYVGDVRLPSRMTFVRPDRLTGFVSGADALLQGEAEPLEAETIVARVVDDALAAAVGQPGGLSSTGRREQVVRRARAFLDAQAGAQPTLDDVARAAGTDRFTLVRYFRAVVGTTPFRYLVLVRLDVARRHLATGTGVAEAAALAGFADQPHLTRWFRRVNGVTPAAYCREARTVHALSTTFKTAAGRPSTLPAHDSND